MSTIPLSIDVYVAPMRPYNCPDQLGEGDVATWAPSSSTLISGPTEGILIDALLTFENADQIAAWAKSFGKKIGGRTSAKAAFFACSIGPTGRIPSPSLNPGSDATGPGERCGVAHAQASSSRGIPLGGCVSLILINWSGVASK